MLKRLFLAGFSVMLAIVLSACGAAGGAKLPELMPEGESGTVSGEEAQAPATMSQEDCEDNLDGLSEYLLGNAAVTGDKVVMSFDVIGAVNGYKYNYAYNGGRIQCEIYEFDLESLNEAGAKALEEVKSKGKIEVLDKEIDAMLSDNGKYLMIYADSSKDDKNAGLRSKIEELFKGFKA
jgi:hypothetical protein